MEKGDGGGEERRLLCPKEEAKGVDVVEGKQTEKELKGEDDGGEETPSSKGGERR